MTQNPESELGAVWSSVDQLLSDLSAEDWERSTDCPGWTVKDQVSHLIGTESMLLGRQAPPPVEAPHASGPMGQINEGWVAERRTQKPEQVLAEFREVTGARRQALNAMTKEEWEAPIDSPIGKVPYREFMSVRVMDNWVHEQDIRRAVGRPGDLDGPAAETALARFTSALGFIVGKRVGAPEGTSVVVQLEGPVVTTLAVTMTDGRAKPTPVPDRPSLTLTMTSETYSCLSSGRWTAQEAVAQGKVKIEGDAQLGQRVLASMNIIP
jgi:uncharacterized protein (TIGR03083 family)